MAPRSSVALGRSRPLLDIPGIEGYGAWCSFTWDNKGSLQHGAALVPSVPSWRQLFAALDEIGAPLSGEPASELDEADAITACCWRYGSYFHALTGGELYPPFRTDPSLSRLGDREMRRVNIEFSAALAAWLATKATDPRRIARRIRAALTTLPMPWRDARQPWLIDVLERAVGAQTATMERRFEEIRGNRPEMMPEPSTAPGAIFRKEANWAVLFCYRNGPIESFHAGAWNRGSEMPGFMRFYAREVAQLERWVSENIAGHLLRRAILSPDALRYASTVGAPANWTLTGETSHVAFLGMPGTGPLEPRLRLLAGRYPRHFGGAISAAEYDIRHDLVRA